jgi:hypothetical protein
MNNLLTTPLEQSITRGWHRIDRAQKAALGIVIAVSVLAFGFEMTNLTFHHDDAVYIFVDDARIGRSLGRFGFGFLHYYTQNAYIMPFLQMAQAIALMAVCGLMIARVWKLERPLDIALVAALVCVFPYMAQIYQYNFCTVPFALAHLLAAAAVMLSIRATVLSVLAAAVLYAATFSVYQAVLANAATLLAFWFLATLLFKVRDGAPVRSALLKPTVAAAVAVILGGLLYIALVAVSGKGVSHYQGADEAFAMRPKLDPTLMASLLSQGSRAFFIWPEHYFPPYLKVLQIVLVGGAALACLSLPKTWRAKAAALVVFGLALVAPRTLHLLHPGGNFHQLTLTAYAVVIAGSLMIILRGAAALLRNAAAVISLIVIAGYVMQCNWISTVNAQNTMAHFAQATQILARARSLPDSNWDGNTIVVSGSLRLFDEYPFRKTTGVSSDFINASHLQYVARLLRDNVKVVPIEEASPTVQAATVHLPVWPHPQSVTVIEGVAVVALGKPRQVPAAEQ